MSSVTWQLIATKRLYRTIPPGVLECVTCAGEIALVGCIEDSKMFKNRDLIIRSQGPQGFPSMSSSLTRPCSTRASVACPLTLVTLTVSELLARIKSRKNHDHHSGYRWRPLRSHPFNVKASGKRHGEGLQSQGPCYSGRMLVMRTSLAMMALARRQIWAD